MRSGDQVVADGALGGAERPPGPAQFTVCERGESVGTIVGVRGELDLCTAPSLGLRLDAIVRHGAGDLTVDLRELEFIDLAGLHILVGAQQLLSSQSRRLKVLCGPGSVGRLIELARLDEALGMVAG